MTRQGAACTQDTGGLGVNNGYTQHCHTGEPGDQFRGRQRQIMLVKYVWTEPQRHVQQKTENC